MKRPTGPESMTIAAFRRLIASGEGPILEFKRSTGELREGMRTACGFLNGDGGKVAFGVKPDGTLVGQEVSDKTLREIALDWSCPGLVEGERLSGLHAPHGTATEGNPKIAPRGAIVDSEATGRSSDPCPLSNMMGDR